MKGGAKLIVGVGAGVRQRNAPRVPEDRVTHISPTKRSVHEETRASPVVPVAVGHPSNLAVEVFSDASWFDTLLAEMRYASTVWIATYVFDDPQWRGNLCVVCEASGAHPLRARSSLTERIMNHERLCIRGHACEKCRNWVLRFFSFRWP